MHHHLKVPTSKKDFILYTFPSDDSLASMLTQKEEGGDEYPISFMSTFLQGDELNYPVVDKKSYVVFKAVKQFRPYILNNRTKVIVSHLAVRSLFIQKELGERRGNWVTALQEYGLEFKLETIVKGKGLCKLMAESQYNEDNNWDNEVELQMVDVCPLFTALES